MTSCYTQRSVPCSDIISEASSCSRKEQIDSQVDILQSQILDRPALNEMSPPNPCLQSSGKHMEEETERF